jgi:hypothetical protein
LMMLQRPVVVVCDNDPAGRKLAKFGHYAEFCPVEGQDLGDCSQEWVLSLVHKYNPNNR